jgi:hypothetical protein
VAGCGHPPAARARALFIISVVSASRWLLLVVVVIAGRAK